MVKIRQILNLRRHHRFLSVGHCLVLDEYHISSFVEHLSYWVVKSLPELSSTMANIDASPHLRLEFEPLILRYMHEGMHPNTRKSLYDSSLSYHALSGISPCKWALGDISIHKHQYLKSHLSDCLESMPLIENTSLSTSFMSIIFATS